MKPRPRLRPTALVLLLPVLLGACDMLGVGTEEGAGEASGEVLEGSISDAMLPVEGLRSQPPRAVPEPGEGEGWGDTGAQADAQGEAQAAAEGEEGPAAGPEEAEPAEE